MIINNLDNKKVKILIDENDLKNSKIPITKLVSDSTNTILFIQKLIKLPEKTIIKDFSIYTYNYKIFLITLSI